MNERELRDAFEAALKRLRDATQLPQWDSGRGGVFMTGKNKEFVVVIAVEKMSAMVVDKVIQGKNEAFSDAKLVVKLGDDEIVH